MGLCTLITVLQTLKTDTDVIDNGVRILGALSTLKVIFQKLKLSILKQNLQVANRQIQQKKSGKRLLNINAINIISLFEIS